jgi:membrane protein required for colicin V production
MLIDIAFSLLMLLALMKGMKKGFIGSLFSSIGFIVAMAAALKLSAVLANRMSTNGFLSGKWVPFLSFVIVFAVVVILFNQLGKIFQKTSEILMLGWLNKFGGVCLFILIYGIIFSIILFYAIQLKLINTQTIDASKTYPFVCPIGPDVINGIGKVIPFFNNLFEQLQHFFGGVSDKI